MVDNHFEVDESGSPSARELKDAMRDLRKAWNRLRGVRGVMIREKDTDASGATVFAQVATNFAFQGADTAAKNANASAAFGEIDGNWDTVDAKIEQMLNSFLP